MRFVMLIIANDVMAANMQKMPEPEASLYLKPSLGYRAKS